MSHGAIDTMQDHDDGLEAEGLGDHHHGESSSVQGQLRNVQQICGACFAFAATLKRRKRGDTGPSKLWWSQLHSPKSAQERLADL